MMPPDMPATELWTTLTTMPRPHRLVDFPRKREDGAPVGQVAIWTLNQGEQIAAGIAAEKLVRKELPDAKRDDSLGYATAYSNASAVEILYRACRDPNDLSRSAFPSASSMRAYLTTDEIAVLFNAYISVQTEVGPIVGALTAEELDAWINRLVEGGSGTDPLVLFSSQTLQDLLKRLVVRYRTSRGAPSSPSSLRADTELGSISSEDDSLTEGEG
jgi:hypothetical protein